MKFNLRGYCHHHFWGEYCAIGALDALGPNLKNLTHSCSNFNVILCSTIVDAATFIIKSKWIHPLCHTLSQSNKYYAPVASPSLGKRRRRLKSLCRSLTSAVYAAVLLNKLCFLAARRQIIGQRLVRFTPFHYVCNRISVSCQETEMSVNLFYSIYWLFSRSLRPFDWHRCWRGMLGLSAFLCIYPLDMTTGDRNHPGTCYPFRILMALSANSGVRPS